MDDTLVHTENRHHGKHTYFGDLVYGANDGIVTTFAIVSGGTGAVLAPGVIIILGIANLVADGISMGLSSYISIRSRLDFAKEQRGVEEDEVKRFPEIEKEEMRKIIRGWGVPEGRLEEVLQGVISDKKRWVDIMMKEELGIYDDGNDHPPFHGIATAVAFIGAGTLPLIPYMFEIPAASRFPVSIVATALSLFVVGAMRSVVTRKPWLRAGLQMLAVGGLAACTAYFVGILIKDIFEIRV